MDQQYQRIQESEAEEPSKTNIFKQVTKKMKDYMFQKQENQQSKLENQPQYKKPVFMVSDMQSTFINMKRSFQYVGDNSTFQKRITWIIVIQWIAFSFMVNSIAFFFKTPVFLCKIPLTQIFIVCSQTIACPLIDTDFVTIRTSTSDQIFNFYQISIAEEFQLYCDKSDYAPWAQSAFFLGGFLSGYLFSYISERIGRRLNLMFILILLTISIFYCALVPTFELFIIGYFFIGFCLFGYETSIYIYIGQISAIRFRTISINMLTMTWSGTPIFLPLLGLLPTWRYTFILFGSILIATIPFVYYCFLQSPRFLLSKKCYKQARQIFQKISITNKRPPYNFKIIEQIQSENQKYLTYSKYNNESPANLLVKGLLPEKNRTYNYLDLFKYSSLKKPTIVLMYWWMFRFFMYYGLNLALQSVLKSGFLLTMIISGAAIMQVLGSFGIPIMTTFCYNKYKLDIMRISLMVTTTCCFLMWFLQIGNDCVVVNANTEQLCIELILMLILVIFIKFFNTVFFSGLLVYYSEVFPTPVRSLGCGFTLTFGRLGTIIVPFYVNYMKVQYYGKNSLCFMTPFGALAVVLCYFMPYTEKEGMKQKIKEQQDAQVFQMVQL